MLPPKKTQQILKEPQNLAKGDMKLGAFFSTIALIDEFSRLVRCHSITEEREGVDELLTLAVVLSPFAI